jgi:hypothetical protein
MKEILIFPHLLYADQNEKRLYSLTAGQVSPFTLQ